MSRWKRPRIGGLWVALVFCVGSSGALATPVPTSQPAPSAVTLLPLLPGPGVAERTAQKLTTLWEEGLQTREDEFFVFSPPESVESATRRQDESVEWLDEGKDALTALALDDAALKFRKAIDAVWKDPANSADTTLVEAHLYLAVVELRRGDEKAARAALAGLLRLQPAYVLPKDQFPPVLARELEKARKTWAKQVKKAITVEGPPGSRAFVNGAEIGMVPEVQADLAPGLHLVRVETTDGGKTTTVVEVRNADVTVTAPFPVPMPVSSEPLVNFHGKLDTALLSELSAYLRANDGDGAILGVVEKSPEDNELKLVSAVYVQKRNAFALLPPMFFGVDLVTANTEVYQLTEGVRHQLRQFGPAVALPHLLLPQAPVAVLEEQTGGAQEQPSKPAPATSVARGPLPSVPDWTEVPAASDVTRTTMAPMPLHPSPVLQSARGVPWWVWVVGGVGLAAAAGGTYYGVSSATRPVSGTVTARW